MLNIRPAGSVKLLVEFLSKGLRAHTRICVVAVLKAGAQIFGGEFFFSAGHSGIYFHGFSVQAFAVIYAGFKNVSAKPRKLCVVNLYHI